MLYRFIFLGLFFVLVSSAIAREYKESQTGFRFSDDSLQTSAAGTKVPDNLPVGKGQTAIPIAGHIAVVQPLPVADGVYEVTLSLHTELAGGELLWEQKYPKVPIRNGRIEARFATVPLDGLEVSGAWLEIFVDGQATGGPNRTRLSQNQSLIVRNEGLIFVDHTISSSVASVYLFSGPGFADLELSNYYGDISFWTGEGGSASPRLNIYPNGRLYLTGGSDASLVEGSGMLQIGSWASPNLVFDGNEIMARNAGSPATLFLQQEGGDIWFHAAPLHTSDRRMKREIRELNIGLDEILRLRPVSFEWKEQQGLRRPGLVAQDVQEVIEGIVSEDEEGTLGLAYTSLIPVFVRAIQEQQDRIKGLEDRLEQLEAEKSIYSASGVVGAGYRKQLSSK